MSDYNRGMMAAVRILRERAEIARNEESYAQSDLARTAMRQISRTLDAAADHIEWMAEG